jgi:hypothetical protein
MYTISGEGMRPPNSSSALDTVMEITQQVVIATKLLPPDIRDSIQRKPNSRIFIPWGRTLYSSPCPCIAGEDTSISFS